MKATFVIFNRIDACNAGGPLTYRRVTLDLTPGQANALAVDEKWEDFGPVIVERAPPSSEHRGGDRCEACKGTGENYVGACAACGGTGQAPGKERG